MPLYKCPKCGRTALLPEGRYSCARCGVDVVMEKISKPGEGLTTPMEAPDYLTIRASEIHIRFAEPGITVINGDTGEMVRVKSNQMVSIKGDEISEVHCYYDKLATVYGFPATVRIEPYYG